MSERSVVAKLRAEVGDYVGPIGKAERATKQLGDATEKTAKRAKTSLSGMAADVRKNEQHYDRLGNAALIGGTAIAAGVGFGVKAFADFDSAMSGANAALVGTGADMDKLRKLAIDLGKDTQFSSTEAAQGITELAKAGVDAKDIYGGGLAGALSLAAAGELEVADAAEIAASAMTQFKLEGKDIPHIADLLAAGAGKAQGSVRDMGMALNQAGLVAAQTGLTIEETTGALASFASAGLVGSDAGTSLKTMLQRLTPQSEEASKQFKALGLSAYDANGNFVGLTDFAGQLQEKLSKLTPEARNSALGVMFGSDAVRAASVIYEQGAGGVQSWIDKVNDAGFAAEQAALKTDNLRGDWERFTGALDAVAVSNGSGANGFLRSLTQNAEGAVEAFGRLPSPVQQTVLGIAGLTGATLLAAGAVSKVVTSGANMIESLDAIATKSPRAASALGKVGKAAGILAAILAAGNVADQIFGSDGGGIGSQRLTKALLGNADAVGAFNKEIATYQERTSAGFWNVNEITDFGDALDAAFNPGKVQQIDNALGTLFGAVGIENQSGIARSAELLGSLDDELTNLASSGSAEVAAEQFNQFALFAEKQGISVDELMTKMPRYAEQLAGLDNEQTLTGESAGAASGELKGLGDTMEASAEAAENAKKALDELQSTIIGMGGGLRAEQQAIADSNKALKEAQELAENAKATREEDEAALRGLSASYLEVAAAQIETGRGAGEIGATMKANREDFIKTAVAMGYNKTFANQLADAYGLIPEKVATQVSAVGAETSAVEVTNLKTQILGLNGKTVTVKEAGKAKESKENVLQLDGAIFGLKDKTVKVQELGSTASGDRVVKFNGKIYTLKGKTVTVTETGATAATSRVSALKAMIDRLRDKRINIGVNTAYTTSGSRSTAGGITRDADGGMHVNGTGGLVKAYADGGMWSGTLGSAQPRIAPAGGKGILWAEEGAGPWEAFISGHPAKRTRSRSIAEDTVGRLGGQIQWLQAYADGGIRDRMSPARQSAPAYMAGSSGPTIRSEEYDQSLRAEVVYITGEPRTWRREFDRDKPLRAKSRPGRD